MRSALIPILLNSVPGWVRNAYPADVLPFLVSAAHYDQGLYWMKGRGQCAIGDIQTCVRAQTVNSYQATASGLLVPFLANVDRRTDAGDAIEQAATNLQLRSQQFSVSPWAPGNGGGGAAAPTITDNQATAPDGTTTAALVQFGTRAANQYQYVNAPQALSTGTYTGSLYFKAADGPSVGSKIDLWQFDGAVKNLATITLTSSWQRLPTTGVSSLTATGAVEADTFGRAASAGGGSTGAVNIHVAAAQIETGSIATSYIPTTTVAVTRNADSTTFNGLNLPAPYSLFLSVGSSAKDSADLLLGGTVNDASLLRISGTTGVLNVIEGGVTTASITAGTMAINTPFKMAGRFAVNDTNLALGGTLGTRDTSTTPATLTALGYGRALYSFGSGVGSVNVNRSAIFAGGLTNAQLQAVTQ